MTVASESISPRRKISIVTGTFNEGENVQEFFSRVLAVMNACPQYDWELTVIDNASTDNTAAQLRQLAASEKRLKVILNSRNFGHIRSGYHAMLQSYGDAIILICSDLQDPPEMIPEFIQQWEKGFKAIVGVKQSSEETPLFFLLRKCYYRLVHRLADIDIIQNFTGFGLYDKQIIDILRSLKDPYPYFRGLISEIGLPTQLISYRQPRRKRGLTKSNFYILYDLAMLGITNHSKVPLRLAAMLGFAMSLLSFLIAAVYLVYKLLYWDRFSLGLAPLIIGIFFFSSVQLFFIGILGEYIGSIHTQILNRPLVVEKERINF